MRGFSLIGLLAISLVLGACGQGPDPRTFATTGVERGIRYLGKTSLESRNPAFNVAPAAPAAPPAAGGAPAGGQLRWQTNVQDALRSSLRSIQDLLKVGEHYLGIAQGWAGDMYDGLPAILQFVLVPSANPWVLGAYYIGVAIALYYLYQWWAAHKARRAEASGHGKTASQPKDAREPQAGTAGRFQLGVAWVRAAPGRAWSALTSESGDTPTPPTTAHPHTASASPSWALGALSVFMAAGLLSRQPALQAMQGGAVNPYVMGPSTFAHAACPMLPSYATAPLDTALHGHTMLFMDDLSDIYAPRPYPACIIDASAPSATTSPSAGFTPAAARPFHHAGGRAFGGWTRSDTTWLFMQDIPSVPATWRRAGEDTRVMHGPASSLYPLLPNHGHSLSIHRDLPITPAWFAPMAPAYLSNVTKIHRTAEPLDMPTAPTSIFMDLQLWHFPLYEWLAMLTMPAAPDCLTIDWRAVAEGAMNWGHGVMQGLQQLGRDPTLRLNGVVQLWSEVRAIGGWQLLEERALAMSPGAAAVAVRQVMVAKGHVVGWRFWVKKSVKILAVEMLLLASNTRAWDCLTKILLYTAMAFACAYVIGFWGLICALAWAGLYRRRSTTPVRPGKRNGGRQASWWPVWPSADPRRAQPIDFNHVLSPPQTHIPYVLSLPWATGLRRLLCSEDSAPHVRGGLWLHIWQLAPPAALDFGWCFHRLFAVKPTRSPDVFSLRGSTGLRRLLRFKDSTPTVVDVLADAADAAGGTCLTRLFGSNVVVVGFAAPAFRMIYHHLGQPAQDGPAAPRTHIRDNTRTRPTNEQAVSIAEGKKAAKKAAQKAAKAQRSMDMQQQQETPGPMPVTPVVQGMRQAPRTTQATRTPAHALAPAGIETGEAQRESGSSGQWGHDGFFAEQAREAREQGFGSRGSNKPRGRGGRGRGRGGGRG